MRASIDFPSVGHAPMPLRAQFDKPIAVLTAWQTSEVEAVVSEAYAHAKAGRWCVGGLAYEAASAFDSALPTHPPRTHWPLARFAVYEHALPWPDEPLALATDTCTPWAFPWSAAQYEQRAQQALQAMREGECYQINLSGQLSAQFVGDSAAWMHRLRLAQPRSFLLHLDWGAQQVLSASPELFFHWQPASGQLLCQPMKGTAARHADTQLDATAREQLLHSDKERAENVMIVDLLRNDMSKLALPGTVQVNNLFELQALPTVWQMTSSISARTRPGVDLVEVFRALFPCGSVTGAPKARAMHWIHQLEDKARGIYCGALGVLQPGGAATFSVPIRTLSLETAQAMQEPIEPQQKVWSARYGVGSGLTVYAKPQAEWHELAAKTRLLERSAKHFDLLETLRLENGQYWLLDEHMNRLMQSAAYFNYNFSREQVLTHLQNLARSLAEAPQAAHHVFMVRLTVSPNAAIHTQATPLAPTPEPVRFALAREPLHTQAANQEFVLHKTTRREHYDALLHPAPALFDTLLTNERGELTEFTRGNLALRLQGSWFTPALHCGLLAGTYRAKLLAEGAIAEAVLQLKDLQAAQEIVFFNSVRGWLRALWVPH
jgi:para-aminobenzoate synthetase / 4-amino-4-deoxychorismate lyase